MGNTLPPQAQARRPRKRVVIVGAGFGGLNAARSLAGSKLDVLLLDRNNYHGFWPLLYQVATAGLEPESIAYPVRAILRRYRNLDFRLCRVTGVDLAGRTVQAGAVRIPYDYLVLAAGSANNYFGNATLAEHTYGLKDIPDAERLRNRILSAFEEAVNERDPARLRQLLTFVIIGGGPTGVEMAGAIAELVHVVLRRDYPMLNTARTRIVLVEASDKILVSFPEQLQEAAKRRLRQLRVKVLLKAPVAQVENNTVTFKDGMRIAAGTVIWAAGVRGAPLADELGLELARGARVPVQTSLNLAAHPNVFVVGDLAYLEGYGEGKAYPQVAPVAMQQGTHAAQNILALVAGHAPTPFLYRDKGNMATIGRRAAVFDAFGIRMSGVIAWFGWLFVHLIYLIGFRNRVIVMLNWAYNYFTYDRGVRLISDNK